MLALIPSPCYVRESHYACMKFYTMHAWTAIRLLLQGDFPVDMGGYGVYGG